MPTPLPNQLIQDKAPFDAAARSYDDDFERLPATRRIRRIVWAVYAKYFRVGTTLLELNCGTGTDAVELASQGIQVVATDSSAGMLEETRKKIAGTGLSRLVKTMQLSFQKLRTLDGETFDGAYSNFGGLNCTRQLDTVAHDLAKLVKPRGYVVLCLMSRFSLWETTSFLLRGKFGKAFRRRQRMGALAHIHGEIVWVTYYSPKEVVAAFAPLFQPVELLGLNIFSPPPAARLAPRILGRSTKLLDKLDDRIASRYPFSAFGDHFVLVLQRV